MKKDRHFLEHLAKSLRNFARESMKKGGHSQELKAMAQNAAAEIIEDYLKANPIQLAEFELPPINPN
jgi:hypothetical protein